MRLHGELIRYQSGWVYLTLTYIQTFGVYLSYYIHSDVCLTSVGLTIAF